MMETKAMATILAAGAVALCWFSGVMVVLLVCSCPGNCSCLGWFVFGCHVLVVGVPVMSTLRLLHELSQKIPDHATGSTSFSATPGIHFKGLNAREKKKLQHHHLPMQRRPEPSCSGAAQAKLAERKAGQPGRSSCPSCCWQNLSQAS